MAAAQLEAQGQAEQLSGRLQALQQELDQRAEEASAAAQVQAEECKAEALGGLAVPAGDAKYQGLQVACADGTEDQRWHLACGMCRLMHGRPWTGGLTDDLAAARSCG